MNDEPDPTRIQERLESIRDPEQDALAAADRADSERDVSMVAMVGLLVLIIGIGFAAWGATTPGFFDSSVGEPIRCTTEAPPPGQPGDPRALCRATVDGRLITGPPQDITRLVEEARGERGFLASPEQRFWLGMALILLGVTLTIIGFIRARRSAG